MAKSRLFSNIKTNDQMETSYSEVRNENLASYKGITIKTAFSIGLTIIAAVLVAFMFRQIFTGTLTEDELATKLLQLLGILAACSVIGFISVIVGRLSVKAARFATPIYAVCEGALVGSLSMICEMYIPGVVGIALVSTIICFVVMLALFASGIIRNQSKFRSFVIAFGASLILGIIAFYIISLFSNFTLSPAAMLAIEVLFLLYGCFSLLLNFMECTAVVKAGCDKSYEWSVSLGLLVTIIYIYVEILRIAMIFASNKD